MSETNKLISAIAKAIGQMGKLAKDSRNKHANYKFTSIDDFLAATGRVCSDNGLVIIQHETSCETITVNGKQWLKLQYDFTVSHESGNSVGPLVRSVAVQFLGAQAFGAAQSYALKQFLRSLFQISTGDNDDPDHSAPSKDVPKIAKPSKITQQQIDRLIELADNSEHFTDAKHLGRFAVEATGVEIKGMSEATAAKFIESMEKNCHEPIDTWSEKGRMAYLKATAKTD